MVDKVNMLFIVGSDNPVKINAVKNVVSKIWPDAKVDFVKVNSGVSGQPIGMEETIRGAVNRAKATLQHYSGKADFGVGLEGGITNNDPYGHFNMPWCAVIDKNGHIGVGCAGAIEIPPELMSKILSGKELGEVMDEKTGIVNSKRKMGAIGILTGGLLDRQRAYEVMVIYALAKFIKPEFYQ